MKKIIILLCSTLILISCDGKIKIKIKDRLIELKVSAENAVATQKEFLPKKDHSKFALSFKRQYDKIQEKNYALIERIQNEIRKPNPFKKDEFQKDIEKKINELNKEIQKLNTTIDQYQSQQKSLTTIIAAITAVIVVADDIIDLYKKIYKIVQEKRGKEAEKFNEFKIKPYNEIGKNKGKSTKKNMSSSLLRISLYPLSCEV
jgi:hypothetical protein